MPRPASSFFLRSGWKLPLRVTLVVPFVLPVVAVVAAMGYLSFRHGQQTVSNLANQSGTAASARIEQTLIPWFGAPANLTRNTAATIRSGILDWHDTASLKRYFEQQLYLAGSVDVVAMRDESGRVLLFKQQHDGSIALHVEERVPSYSPISVAAQTGEPFFSPISDRDTSTYPDLRRDDWYLAAKAIGQPSWQLMTAMDGMNEPVLKAVNIQPFYDRAHRFQGVLTTAVDLARLNAFLKDLHIAKTGQAFIIDQRGLLVATANEKSLFHRSAAVLEPLTPSTAQQQREAPRRLNAVNSHDFLTQKVAVSLVDRFGSVDHLYTRQQFSLVIDRQTYFIYLEPLENVKDLHWLAVVVVPEVDFIDTIHSHNRLTFWLCAGALTAAIVLGWLTASQIARPILRLSRASRELALGEWQHPVESQSQIAELEVLAHSFNQMAVHLQQSFDQVKTALQESEERFTKVFRSSPDAISIATLPDRRYIEVNDRFLTISGYSYKEVIGQSAVSLSMVVNPEQVACFTRRLQTHQRVHDVEMDFRHKQGQIGTVLVSAEVIELGGETCLLCLYRDITARKRAEDALRESEQRFRNAFDTTAVGMSLAAPDGRFVQVNTSLCQMLGYTEAELQALKFSEITHPDDLAATVACAQKLLAGEISYYHLEKRYWHREGHIIWCLLSVSLVRDRQQQPLYFVAQMQDITKQQAALEERQQAEAASQTAEAQLHQRLAALSTLNQIAQTLVTTVDVPTALKTTAALITHHFDACETAISLLTKHRTALRTIASYHLAPHMPSLLGVMFPLESDDSAAPLVEYRESIVITPTDTNPSTEFARKIMQTRQVECLLLVGLQVRCEVIGIVSIASQQKGRVFTAEEVTLAETIAGQIAGAVQTTRLVEPASTKATTNLAKSALLAAMSHKLQVPFNAILDVVQRL